jgi:hypothetical protein
MKDQTGSVEGFEKYNSTPFGWFLSYFETLTITLESPDGGFYQERRKGK